MSSIWNTIKKDVERFHAPDDISLAHGCPQLPTIVVLRLLLSYMWSNFNGFRSLLHYRLAISNANVGLKIVRRILLLLFPVSIYLPLPPALHFKWAKLALQHCKHVLLEKPSTTSLSDTQELVRLAGEKGMALHENYMFVFHNQIQAVKDIVNRGEIGDVRLYRITFGFPRRAANDFRYNKALGGGALLDAGGYTMKLATILLGGEVKITAANAGYLDEYDVDIYGSATAVNEKGHVAQLAFGMDNDYRCDLEVWGSMGTLSTGRILTAPKDFVPTFTLKNNQDLQTGNLPADDAVLKSIQHFGQCIYNKEMRQKNYKILIQQEKLVDEFMKIAI